MLRAKNLTVFLYLALFLVGGFAQAKTIMSLTVKGNKRIEQAAILNKIQSKPGKEFSSKRITKDVKALFETGFFYDIVVEDINGGLVYTVTEKPAIKEIEFLGNRAFNDDDLNEVLKFDVNELLDVKKINQAVVDIQKKYEEKGYYLAKVNYETKSKGVGFEKLIFKVKENDKVKIRRVLIVGNNNLSEQKIKSVMATKEVGFLGMGGSFQQEALDRDREIIRFLYMDKGYAQVRVSKPVVSLTPDKRGINITFNLNEGLRYKIGSVEFTGDLLFESDELLKETSVDEEEFFSQSKLLRDISKLQAKYGDEGYAYANVVPAPRVPPGSDTMDIIFKMSKGEKIFLGEINMKGNTKTRDKVIRRELRIFEGELYNETNKRKSIANVRRLGFFDNVDFQAKPNEDDPNVMDMDIKIEERSTGQLNLGAGYGGFTGFSIQGSVQQTNFMGKGINLGVNVNWSEERQQLFNINVTDPYFRDTDWSLGFDGYQSLQQFIDFQETKVGGGIRAGKRFSDYLTLSLRYKLEKVEIELDNDAFLDVYERDTNMDGNADRFLVDEAEGLSSSVTATMTYDKRNDRQFPTKGFFTRFSLEQAGIGGDLKYTKGLVDLRYYKPLFGSLVWRNRLQYGFVGGVGGDDPPFNELFRLGGPNTIRGYDFFSIAERVDSNDAFNASFPSDDAEARGTVPFGGKQQILYNLELQWALIKEAGINGVVFFDVGSATDKLLGQVESSYGFGVRWISPLGPLRFEWGFPINPDKAFGEKEWDFDFSIISSF